MGKYGISLIFEVHKVREVNKEMSLKDSLRYGNLSDEESVLAAVDLIGLGHFAWVYEFTQCGNYKWAYDPRISYPLSNNGKLGLDVE